MNRWQQAGSGCSRWTARRWAWCSTASISGPGRHPRRAAIGAGGENHLRSARRCAVYENGSPEWSRHFRCFPGQGELPLEAFAEQITRCGYRGPWSLEIFNDGFRASPNGATAKDGYRSLLWLEEQTRRRLPACDADLFSPPPLPVYHGLEFIEFAASVAEAQRRGSICRLWVFSTREATAPNRSRCGATAGRGS